MCVFFFSMFTILYNYLIPEHFHIPQKKQHTHQQPVQIPPSPFHKGKWLSRVRFSGTPWTAARQAPLSLGFSSQEYLNGLPCPPPGDLPDSGTEPLFLMPPILVGGLLPLVPPGKSLCLFYVSANELADSLPSTVYLYVFFEIYLYTWLCWVRWGTWNL